MEMVDWLPRKAHDNTPGSQFATLPEPPGAAQARDD
jgi:hypothetical protein